MKKPCDAQITHCSAIFAILLASTLGGAGAPSRAQTNGCASFAWPVTLERKWFAASDLPSFHSGASLATFLEGGLNLVLLPLPDVRFVVTPETPMQSGWGGLMFLPPPDKPGVYQVTLSEKAWVDVIQGGVRITSQGHTGSMDCLEVRKSIRFVLGPGPVTLQISGASKPTLRVAIRNITDNLTLD